MRKSKAIKHEEDTIMLEATMEQNSGEKPAYYYQKHYSSCSHTSNKFGWYDKKREDQFKAGRMPFICVEDFCSDCRARREIDGNTLDDHITFLRTKINGYVVRLDGFSREAREKDAQLERLRQDKADLLKQSNKQHLELERARNEVTEKDAELAKLQKTIKTQGTELGNLRRKVKDSPSKNGLAVQTPILQPTPTPPKDELAVKNPNLEPLGSPTKNGLPMQSPSLQDTVKEKKLKLIATMGYINPIASGFNTLKQGLEEHKWDPYIMSLFTELTEAVRRNEWEEICSIHDRMHTFAEAFDNDLKERIQKTEQEIIKQCEDGVQRLLSTMM
jgi:hypothetical protein